MKCSTMLFAHGVYGVTVVCLNPMCFAKFAKSWLLNGGPLSVPSLLGMLKFVMILSIAGMMDDVDVDVTISIAEKQEYKHCTTSTYSLLGSCPKRSARRCFQGPFGSSVILNGSCCLALVVTALQGRHSFTAMISFLSISRNQMHSLAHCFVFTNP